MPSELNKEHLQYLESKSGSYYKECLDLATELAKTREIKVVDLYVSSYPTRVSTTKSLLFMIRTKA